MTLLTLDAISYIYPEALSPALNAVSLSLRQGERIGILGNNGSGKSTLLHIAAGLIIPTAGKIFYGKQPCSTEKDFANARKHLGYLLQQSEDMLFCPSILEDVAFGPYNQGIPLKEAEATARAMLDSLGLSHLSSRNGNSLSGGEKKLAALASILVMSPSILFLDEPTNDLDPSARERLISILKACALPGLCISHDYSFMQQICTRFLILENGQLGECSLFF